MALICRSFDMPSFIWVIRVAIPPLQFSGSSCIRTERILYQIFHNTVSRRYYVISSSQFVPHTLITMKHGRVFYFYFYLFDLSSFWFCDEYRGELIWIHTWNLLNGTLWRRFYLSDHSSPIPLLHMH